MTLVRRLFSRQPSAAPERDWIDAADWAALVERHAFLQRLDPDAASRLRSLCGAFLATKAVNAAGGLALDDSMVASIAVQACLPILELGLEAYPRFEEIIVYPGDFVVEREIVDDDGIVHEWTENIVGESWEGGPIVLAWDAASGERGGKAARPSPFAFNVVIHEFAHKLDMGNGAVDGTPAFVRALHGSLDATTWRTVLDASLDDFTARVEAAEDAIPRHIDPESARADRYFADLPFDAYAATDEAEFFSVTSETFFVMPARLHEAYPGWYAMLERYYRQRPLD